MALQSALPTDVTPARRLHEYVELVRQMSLADDPQELILSFRERAGFVIPADHRVTLSRKGLTGNAVRVTRSTRWEEDVNPWKEPDRLPVLEHGLLCDLMAAGQPVKIDELVLDPDDPSYEHLEGMGSLLAAPLYYEGEAMYMVVMLREQPYAFTLDNLCDALLTGNLIGRATSNLVMAQELRKAYGALDREFHAVGQIQRGLLPAKLPDIPNVTIATQYETSTRAGGDYYDFFALPEGKWGLIIADVSGHGPSAAVVMAMLRTLLQSQRLLQREHNITPPAILEYLNRGLVDSISASQFATAFVAVYDPVTRQLRYASAGHNPPRWLHGEQHEIVPLDGEPGLPLAIVPDYDAPEHAIQLAAGDRLLLYTDGITEASNRNHVMFGTEGVDRALHCCSNTPAGLIKAIDDAVRSHVGDLAPEDDRTLVALAFD